MGSEMCIRDRERGIMLDVVSRTAEQVFIPLTVGGGIRTVDDMNKMLKAGADKVSINTAAVENPRLIQEGAYTFGSQCIVLGLDAMRIQGSNPLRWEVRVRTGSAGGKSTGLDAIKWVVRAVELGVGEIVANSMDCDGTQDGYDLDLNKTISEVVSVPVVASGGAGRLEHLCEVATEGKADAVLAASIFHFGTYSVSQAKKYLASKGVSVRI